MKKLIILSSVLLSLIAIPQAQAGDNWEVRRLKSGKCEVVKVKPGAKPGTRVAGPYAVKAKANSKRKDLRKTPKCK